MKKYLYYESGLEIWTDKDCHDYFERCSALEKQKSEGTTFVTWMNEMIKMQILCPVLLVGNRQKENNLL